MVFERPFVFSLVSSALIVFLTIIPLAIARYSKGLNLDDIRNPRILTTRMPMWGKRSVWAHQNSLEAFLLHSPAIILTLLASIETGHTMSVLSAQAAILHPLFRLLYNFFYIFNKPIFRALFWGGGILSTAVIYSEAIKDLV